MAYYSVAMLALSVLLAQRDSVYDDMVVKFLEQMVLVMDALEASGCYDKNDGFFMTCSPMPPATPSRSRCKPSLG